MSRNNFSKIFKFLSRSHIKFSRPPSPYAGVAGIKKASPPPGGGRVAYLLATCKTLSKQMEGKNKEGSAIQ